MAPDCRAGLWLPAVSAPLLALDVDHSVLRIYGMTLGMLPILSLDIKF